MKCKTWCVDLEHNEVAQVYASQLKDRVLRFGLEHPGSQAATVGGSNVDPRNAGLYRPESEYDNGKTTPLKMYLLLEVVIYHRHLSFQGC